MGVKNPLDDSADLEDEIDPEKGETSDFGIHLPGGDDCVERALSRFCSARDQVWNEKDIYWRGTNDKKEVRVRPDSINWSLVAQYARERQGSPEYRDITPSRPRGVLGLPGRMAGALKRAVSRVTDR